MNLYCQTCNENHGFDAVDVERIAYGLQAELAETLTNDDGEGRIFYEQFKGKGAEDATFCLQRHLNTARDWEMYGEHTASITDARRRLEGVVACDNCGGDVSGHNGDGVPLCVKCTAEVA